MLLDEQPPCFELKSAATPHQYLHVIVESAQAGVRGTAGVFPIHSAGKFPVNAMLGDEYAAARRSSFIVIGRSCEPRRDRKQAGDPAAVSPSIFYERYKPAPPAYIYSIRRGRSRETRPAAMQ